MKQTITFARNLNDADVGFYFLGKQEQCNVAMVFVGILARPVPFSEWFATLARGVDEIPRFKDYLRSAPFDIGPPIWCPCENFRMADNMQEVVLPNGAAWHDALAVVDRLQSEPFPANKPPWQFVVIKGLPSGNDILMMKVHHALSDGTALALMFSKTFARKFFEDAGVEVTVECEPPPSRRALLTALDGCHNALARWMRHGRAYWPKLLRERAALRNEIETLRRITLPERRWPHRSYSAKRRISGFRVEASTWREEARRRNGGTNDLYLAIVAGVMRRYWKTLDLDAAPLQVVMPVNARDGEEKQDGGNVTGVGVLSLSGGRTDLEDLSDIGKQAKHVKDEALRQEQGIASASIALLPGGLRARLQFREFATRDIVASNVPMPIPCELCEAPFEAMFMIAPAIGTAVSFTLTTYCDYLYLAANADLGIIHEAMRFDVCVAMTLEEVLGSGTVQRLGDGTMSAAGVPDAASAF